MCATGSTDATDVSVDFTWDSANSFVALRPGSLSSIDLGSIAAGDCADAYFEVEVDRDDAAYDTARRFHITATDPVSERLAATQGYNQLESFINFPNTIFQTLSGGPT